MWHLFLICVSCFCMSGCVFHTVVPSKERFEVGRAECDAAAAIGRKEGCSLTSIYVGRQAFGYGFDVYDKAFATIKEARRFIIRNTEMYLNTLNGDKYRHLRPYMSAYPMTTKNVVMHFSFYMNTRRRFFSKPHVQRIKQDSGIIYYTLVDEDGSVLTVHQETYQAAKRALHKISDLYVLRT